MTDEMNAATAAEKTAKRWQDCRCSADIAAGETTAGETAAVDLAVVSLLVSGDISSQIPGDRERRIVSQRCICYYEHIQIQHYKEYKQQSFHCNNNTCVF